MLEGSDFIKIKYYTVLCFLTNADEEVFGQLIQVFTNAKEKLSRSDKFSAYSYVAGVYEILFRLRICKYEKDFLMHMIEVVEKNIYSDIIDDYIDLYTFTDVISICNRNRDSETLKKFIKGNIHRVHPDKRDSMLNYSLSKLSFMEKNYENTIIYSAKSDLNGFFDSNRDNCYYKITMKILIAYSYYELGHFEEVLTVIDSSVHFIKKNTLIKTVEASRLMNFFKSLKKIVLINFKYDAIKNGKLYEDINNLTDVNYKNWLLEKVNELKIKFEPETYI